MRPLIIIHGWSDEAASFTKLAELLEAKTERQVEHLWLGDYVSLDDDIRIGDLAAAMQRAWTDGAHPLPTSANSCDAIVHSTGGLVIRAWMADYWHAEGERPPIANLVMLAPANFGSPLAHCGRALIGRVVKGFKSEKLFQTGTHILKALEMASPYTWDLADKDRFSDNVFNKGGVRCTVIVGNTGYKGISSIANKNGSDGTVYVATADLNCVKLDINFETDPMNPTMSVPATAKGATALLVVNNKDHASIAFKDSSRPKHLASVIEALDVTAAGFAAWRRKCRALTDEVMAAHSKKWRADKHGYQNTVFRVHDHMGNAVRDYVVEFYQDVDKHEDRLAMLFNRDAIGNTHVYGDDTSLRSFMINCTRLFKLIDKPGEFLKVSLSALPDIDEKVNLVGYRTTGPNDIGCVVLSPDLLADLFQQNRTVFVDVMLKREQDPRVFAIKPFKET